VLDNAGTHKTKLIRDWLPKRLRYYVHFTPTSASWINQIERWFGLLTERGQVHQPRRLPCQDRLLCGRRPFLAVSSWLGEQ
jgi:hypothetical protein